MKDIKESLEVWHPWPDTDPIEEHDITDMPIKRLKKLKLRLGLKYDSTYTICHTVEIDGNLTRTKL